METERRLSHIDEQGRIHMVDTGHKTATTRTAKAQCLVHVPAPVVAQLQLQGHHSAKGHIIDTAILAGIMGAKQTSALIPLCHPLPLQQIEINIEPIDTGYRITSQVKTHHTTGVEMEALTGASIAALTIYDMCKALSHDIQIGPLELMQKTGGKNNFER